MSHRYLEDLAEQKNVDNHTRLLNEYTTLSTKPDYKYHHITMSWPFTNNDGYVFVDEAKWDDENWTHLDWADHRSIFANPRLWVLVGKLVE